MDFHENECILMHFLVRTSSREIAAADTLTAGPWSKLIRAQEITVTSRFAIGGRPVPDSAAVLPTGARQRCGGGVV